MEHKYYITTTRNFADGAEEEASHVVKLASEVGSILATLLAEHAECKITSFVLVVA